VELTVTGHPEKFLKGMLKGYKNLLLENKTKKSFKALKFYAQLG